MTHQYPCLAPGCTQEADIGSEPGIQFAWVFEFCSRKCWETVDILQHLRAEGEELTDIAAEEIELRDKRIANMGSIIDRLIEAFGPVAVNRVLAK